MIFSSIFICEHESSICGYKGPTMFDLGLLRTLGQVWMSLGTSQVHSICFLCEFRDFTGPLSFIWTFHVFIWVLKHLGFCLSQFRTDLT